MTKTDYRQLACDIFFSFMLGGAIGFVCVAGPTILKIPIASNEYMLAVELYAAIFGGSAITFYIARKYQLFKFKDIKCPTCGNYMHNKLQS